MLQFSSNESISLEKQVNNSVALVHTKPENLETEYEIERCTNWVKSNGFKNVCLQFPDFLLPDSTEVATHLQSKLGQTVYVMGDTAYESCCVDYVSAAHVNGDAVIHYGPTCFSKASDNIPCLYVYEKKPLELNQFKEAFRKRYTSNDVVIILLDAPYVAHLDDVRNVFSDWSNVWIYPVNCDSLNLKEFDVVFVCENERKVANLYLSFKPKDLYCYNPESKSTDLINYEQDPKILKRRYFLIEKIKDSNTIGIIIGTLAVRNYLKVIERIKKLIWHNGKKYYVISVGKPTVAKLANFPEVDIYVVISCAMNEIYDSRDFYKPIVTPFDVELALNPYSHDLLRFSYDYNSCLPETELDLKALKQCKEENESDVSLITGKVRMVPSHEDNEETSAGSEVALKSGDTIAVSTAFGAGFLGERSWRGLEQNLGRDKPEVASEGRRGIAQGYENEQL